MRSRKRREDEGEEGDCDEGVRKDLEEGFELRWCHVKSQSLDQSLSKSKRSGWYLSLCIIAKDATGRIIVIVRKLGGVFDIELRDLGVGGLGTNSAELSQCCHKGPVGDLGSVSPEAVADVL